jgi:hypothetical protein
MATDVPGWAYVGGRYLAVALATVGAATLLLLAVVVTTLLAHLTRPDTYPALALPDVLRIWGLLTVPPAFLLCSVGFALGTLQPRRNNLIRIVLLLAWFALEGLLPQWAYQYDAPLWYQAWDPTGVAQTPVMLDRFVRSLAPLLHTPSLNFASVTTLVLQLEQRRPDLGLVAWPHLAWAVVGLLLVLFALLRFRRFEQVYS